MEESNLKKVGPFISKKVKEKKRKVPDEKNKAKNNDLRRFFFIF